MACLILLKLGLFAAFVALNVLDAGLIASVLKRDQKPIGTLDGGLGVLPVKLLLTLVAFVGMWFVAWQWLLALIVAMGVLCALHGWQGMPDDV